MAQQHSPLKIGDVAPSFALQTSDGRDIRLVDIVRSNAVIVFFIRGTW